MKKRRRHILSLMGCIVLAGLLAGFIIPGRREPSYGGRTLSSWLDDVGRSGSYVRGGVVLTASARENAALDAIRQMGPEVAPFLVEMCKVEDSRLRKLFLAKLGRHRFKLGLSTAEEKRSRIQTTLFLLGTNAAVAWKLVVLDPAIKADLRLSAMYRCQTLPEDAPQMVPAMVRLIADLEPGWRDHARTTVSKFSPESALPILVRQLRDPERKIQMATMSAIKSFGFRGKPAIPALEQELQTPDNEIALAAADALLSIDAHNVQALICRMHRADLGIRTGAYWLLAREEAAPSTVVPEFIRGLSDPEPEVRQAAAESLAKYGTNAQLALSGLTNLFSDSKRYVRRAASNAVQQIAPRK